MACRGLRGAITVNGDGPDAVRDATVELLEALVAENGCQVNDIAAAIFTVPDDLAGSNPAAAAREYGWDRVPLLAVREHGGDRHVPRCLRILVLWNTSRAQTEVRHAYLRGAASLRPDLEAGP
ncbi:MAG TPA: chorismate mutase [Actinomycetota bacterium]|nr:chorismate mutase [Actinomycetota bacterium]